jgi:hypothetical protein
LNDMATSFDTESVEMTEAGMTSPIAPDALDALICEPPAPTHIINDVYDPEISAALRMLASTFTQRDDVTTLFREGGNGVELGVAGGDFSERILNRSKIGYLYSIDRWEGDRGHDMQQYREAIARLSAHRDRNAILRMRFDEALRLFPDYSLDFIYVDGYAHDGELDGATFRDWFPKLMSGGIIAGNNYHADWPLVVAAVDRFVAENGLELHVMRGGDADSETQQYPAWFAMKP